ncbi:Targeting protein for Xklp2 protein [Fasciola hepatica]|uniref:Targeting protein for Xklp2 protein n=1 Tax=Fasciola hepatica TaxID=6192 RepID=A0A4E0RSC4_FASHE|nr:Targeting protein for Xklp2 protein [Fasciola hepatica]
MLGSRRKSHVMVTRLDVVATPERLPNHVDKENLFPVKIDSHSKQHDKFSGTDLHIPVLLSTTDPSESEAELVSPSRYGGIAFKTKNVTVPKPFSFEAREMEVLHKRKVLAECADKRAVELANSFRARPMRVGSPDPLPQRPAPSPVRPMPFSFRTEERIDLHRSRRQESLTSDESTMQRTRVKSPSVVHRPPFVPQLSTRSPLVPNPPRLATSERAVQRLKFDEMLQRRRHSVELKQQAMEASRRAEEEKQVKRLRQELVHKPQPIRRYKSVRSVDRKPVTHAKSPSFLRRISHAPSS